LVQRALRGGASRRALVCSGVTEAAAIIHPWKIRCKINGRRLNRVAQL
jgi:hypothetical protein